MNKCICDVIKKCSDSNLRKDFRDLRSALREQHNEYERFISRQDIDIEHKMIGIGSWILELQELKSIMDGIEFEIEEYIQEVATESLDLIKADQEEDEDND